MTEEQQTGPPIPPFLVHLCIAAIQATQAWSAMRTPMPELDPAMQQLREAVHPLLAWYTRSTAAPGKAEP